MTTDIKTVAVCGAGGIMGAGIASPANIDKAIFEVSGAAGYAPARRAAVAKTRQARA